MSFHFEANLQDYLDPNVFSKAKTWQVADLAQMARNNRARTDLTLTTNSGKLYGKVPCQFHSLTFIDMCHFNECHCFLRLCLFVQEANRFLEPTEMLESLQVPTTRQHARLCKSVRLECKDVSATSLKKMAGNGMHVPCVGVAIICAQLCFVPN